MTDLPLLTLLTLTPLIGVVVIMALPATLARASRPIALGTSLLTLLEGLLLASRFRTDGGQLQFIERAPWIPSVGAEYFVGADGLNLLLILLTTLLIPFAIATSTVPSERPRLYFILILALETGLLGNFTALNFVHWFLYWELGLVPAYFLIKFWGGPGRRAAALQFFLFTFAGSVALLLAFQALFTLVLAGVHMGLWRQQKQRWYATWGIAWMLYAMRLGLISAYLTDPGRNEVWLFLHQALTGITALLLLLAAQQFSSNARWRRRYVVVGLAAVGWAAYSVLVMHNMALAGASSVVLLSGVTLTTGTVFWRHNRMFPSSGARMLAWVYMLWGFHHLDYPFLRPLGQGVLYGVFLDIIFIVSVTVGTLVLVLGQERRQLEQRTQQLEQLSQLLLRAQEEERRRIARELHDEAGQALTALKIELDLEGRKEASALAARAQPLDHHLRAVHRRAFLVAGEQKGDGDGRLGRGGQELLDGDDEGGDRRLHVAGTAPVQPAVALRGLERRAAPLLHGAGGHHVGMAGKHYCFNSFLRFIDGRCRPFCP